MNTSKTTEEKISATPTLKTVNQFCQENPWITSGGLRYQIFNAKENGLEEAGAILRVGRKVLIVVEPYFSWMGVPK